MGDYGPIAVAIIAFILSPLLVSMHADKRARAKELRDNARQDAVAARLAAENKRVADAAVVAAGAANEKLDQIHTLVNSNMTEAIESELRATRRELAGLREIVELRRAAGQEPTSDALAAIKATEVRIGELTSILADRANREDTSS